MIKEIYIIRHGQTKENKTGIVQGQGVDSSLNEKGRRQARAFYDFYKDIPFEVVLTSKLQRTHQTVAGFLESGIPWEQFEELNEIDWGIHEGKNWSPEIVAGYRQLVAEWQSGNFEAKVEGGESANDLSERLSRFVGILKGRTENRILICSHGRAMRCLMSVLKEEDARSMEDYNHANTGLYKVILENGEFSFERENDVRHLEGSTA